jgi:hypothetical protein
MIIFLFALAFGANECAVLIDAGSTGSRFWIYSWTANITAWVNEVPSDLSAEKSYKFSPGIIDYFEDTLAMQAEFQAGLDEVLSYIQEEEDRCQNISDIKMCLMSTAGLRTESNADVEKILEEVEFWFEENAPFDWKFGRLLSGEEEGTYAWIGNNFVLGLLGEGDKVGIMEMGGQSFQIAFVPRNGIIMDNSYNVELFGITYRIYANGWNGFGLQGIFANINDMLFTDEGNTFMNGTTHPCLPEGWSNDLSSELDWPYQGKYNSTKCLALLKYYFEEYSVSEVCDYDECSMAGRYVSDMANVDFYGLAGFYYMAEGLNRLNESLGYSPSTGSLSPVIEAMCELNATQLATQLEGYYAKYDAWNCYQAKIIYQIMLILPNLGVNGSITYDSPENADGIEGTWLLGALIEMMYSDATADVEGDYRAEMDVESGGGNDNKYLSYFIIFLVLFVIALIGLCYVSFNRTKVIDLNTPAKSTDEL